MIDAHRPLHKAVAHYLFVESKDLPDGEARLLRAAALVLINKPIPKALLDTAEKTKLDDEPLYTDAIRGGPDLIEVWDQQV